MEQVFYLIVKALIMAYMLLEVYRIFGGEQGERLFRFLMPKQQKGQKEKTKTLVSTLTPTESSIVGKSQTVYLEAPPEKKPILPTFSEDLPQVPAYEAEADITADNVEVNLGEDSLTEEDRFVPIDTAFDNEMSSSGMTYEQISQAVEVLQGIRKNESDKSAVARILYEVEGSNLFDFLALQAENEAMVERLLKENLDDSVETVSENEPKKRKEIPDFDMEKYV